MVLRNKVLVPRWYQDIEFTLTINDGRGEKVPVEDNFMADLMANMEVGETRMGKTLRYIYRDDLGNRLYEVFDEDGKYSVYKVTGERELVGPGFNDLQAAKNFIKQDMYPIA